MPFVNDRVHLTAESHLLLSDSGSENWMLRYSQNRGRMASLVQAAVLARFLVAMSKTN